MKKYIATTIAATGLLIFVFGTESSAQTARRLTVEIPFEFYVGEEKFPSGKYEFEQTMRQTNNGALIVRSAGKSARRSVLVPTMAQAGKGGSEVVLLFNRYGSEHFLSKLDLGAGDPAFGLAKSSGEERLAKQNQLAYPVTLRQALAKRD